MGSNNGNEVAESKLNRRNVLRTLGTSGAVAASSGIASAQANNGPKTTIEAESEPASRTEAESALQTDPAQDLLSSLKHPSQRGNGNNKKAVSVDHIENLRTSPSRC